MTNCALYIKGSDDILHFIFDCVKKGHNFIGSNIKLTGLKPDVWGHKWTDEIIFPETLADDKFTWAKKVSELSDALIDSEIKDVSDVDYGEALRVRRLLNDLTYDELEALIDKDITDLKSAKKYLKKLSKVVLAMSKLIDRRD